MIRARVRRMIRATIKSASLPLLLIPVLWLPAESSHAATVEAPFTLELGLHQSNAGGAGRFVDDMASDGVSVDIEGYDTSRLARQFSVGYQFRSWAGVQLGYLDLGDVTVDIQAQAATVDALQSAFARHYPATGDGWTLGYRYRYRYSLAESVDVTADLGLFFWTRDIDVFGESIRSVDDSGTDPVFAVGVDYQLDESLSIGVRLQRVYVDVEHANLLGGVLAWRF